MIFLDMVLAFLGISRTQFYVGLSVIAVIGGLAFAYSQQSKKVDVLKEQAVTLKVENKSLVNDISVNDKLGKVKEAVNVKLASDTALVSDAHDEIISTAKAKVKIIEDTFNKGTDIVRSNPKNKTLEDTATSTIYINGLWDAFCAGVPSANECKKPA